MPATTQRLKIPYPIDTDKTSKYPGTAKQAADIIDQALASTPATTITTTLAGNASGTLTTHITHITTPATSVTGGVYVTLPAGPWTGIGEITITPRNTDQTPLACSLESVTTTQALLRFAKHDGYYYARTGVPITLRITGWKQP